MKWHNTSIPILGWTQFAWWRTKPKDLLDMIFIFKFTAIQVFKKY